MLYDWILIVGGVFAFFAAMGIGANDVANAYATSVASKALTIKQAVVLAGIFETAGAVLMGSHVSDTIRKGIADYQCFEDNPGSLMYGCMWVLFVVGSWLFVASYAEMPVSATHSCVGAMVGMTLVLGGPDCVVWYKVLPGFPYIGGVSGILISWVVSPLLSALVSAGIFALLRYSLLRREFGQERARIVYPLVVGLVVTTNLFFILYKGAKGLGLDQTTITIALSVSIGTGVLFALVAFFCMNKIATRAEDRVDRLEEGPGIEMRQSKLNIKNKRELSRVVALHEGVEKFDPRTEEMFKSLQVVTAICDSFSHGANDVANTVGPFAAIYMIWQTGMVDEDSSLQGGAYGILAGGGFGIALGLLIYGYKILYAIGEKLCKITPSRGVSIELGSALVVLVGSRLQIPLSTTHCQIGSMVGVGALEGCNFSGINGKLLLRTLLGWLLTLVVAASFTAVLVAQGIYSPPFSPPFSPNSTVV
jgi:sodium-dependent phosphate transporter